MHGATIKNQCFEYFISHDHFIFFLFREENCLLQWTFQLKLTPISLFARSFPRLVPVGLVIAVLGRHCCVVMSDAVQEGHYYNCWIQSGPKKCIHSLLINIFGINLNEISISGWECNIMFSQQMAQALL